MILIGLAWLLIVAIALYQVMHGVFSAVIMAFLTTVSAVVAFGCYEWIGTGFLYSTQAAYADALSLILIFVILLLILRTVSDKLIGGNVVLGVWADRVGGGILGLYIGTVMVGILTIALQMLPYGASILGYKPFDSSLQPDQRLYCDEFVLGVVKSTSGLAGGERYAFRHDNPRLEWFCARNTAGKNGRIDAPEDAFTIPAAFKLKPDGEMWKQVVDYDKLPPDPLNAEGKSEILIVQTRVIPTVRGEDNWYRLPATHFRLITGVGRSLYPLGYITVADGKWRLNPVPVQGGKALIAEMCVFNQHKGQAFEEISWVYRLPLPESDEMVFHADGVGDEKDKEKAHKAKVTQRYAPAHMIFRRTAGFKVPNITPNILPEIPKPTTQPKTP